MFSQSEVVASTSAMNTVFNWSTTAYTPATRYRPIGSTLYPYKLNASQCDEPAAADRLHSRYY